MLFYRCDCCGEICELTYISEDTDIQVSECCKEDYATGDDEPDYSDLADEPRDFDRENHGIEAY